MTNDKDIRVPEPTLLTAGEVAQICRVSLRTVRRWIAGGELEAVRLGTIVRIRRRTLDAFMRKSISK